MNVSALKFPPNSTIILTSALVDEIKGRIAQSLFSIIASQYSVRISDPLLKYSQLVEKKVKEIGEEKLSKADISLLAIAVQYNDKEKKLCVLSKDYSVCNVGQFLGIKIDHLANKRNFQSRNYTYKCKGCNITFKEFFESCQDCGHNKYLRISHS